jgi:uncharacterized protein (DUF1778 family)
MAEVNGSAKGERIWLRCSAEEKLGAAVAARRAGFKTTTAYVMWLVRCAARTAIESARAVNVSALVGR